MLPAGTRDVERRLTPWREHEGGVADGACEQRDRGETDDGAAPAQHPGPALCGPVEHHRGLDGGDLLEPHATTAVMPPPTRR